MHELMTWLAAHPAWLPVMIFCARVMDVSLGTVRTICIVRGLRLVASCIGFVEVTIWLVAISSVVHHLESPLNMVTYAAGFATGNWVGMWLETKLALGQQIVRLISCDTTHDLANELRHAGFVVTEIDGHGRDSAVRVCFVAVARRDVSTVITRATGVDPDVFVTVEDMRATNRQLYRRIPNKGGWRSVIKDK